MSNEYTTYWEVSGCEICINVRDKYLELLGSIARVEKLITKLQISLWISRLKLLYIIVLILGVLLLSHYIGGYGLSGFVSASILSPPTILVAVAAYIYLTPKGKNRDGGSIKATLKTLIFGNPKRKLEIESLKHAQIELIKLRKLYEIILNKCSGKCYI